MTFDELPLFEAIHDVYRTIQSPRSSTWLIDEAKREQLCRIIQGLLPLASPFSVSQTLAAWDLYGKSSLVGDLKKVELAVMVARAYGRTCFYRGRGKGDCSAEVSIDRIVPGSRGGVYRIENCVIACSFHNTQRGDLPMEEYLR